MSHRNIRTSDGRALGTVVDFSADSIVIIDGGGRRHTIPKSYLDEKEEGSMLARLSIDSHADANTLQGKRDQ